MVEVKWTDQALRDIDNIARFIANDSENYARIQVQRFFTGAQVLNSFPKSGRIVPETNQQNIRELIIGNYRIIYFIINVTRVDIITVHHSAMLLQKKILKRK